MNAYIKSILQKVRQLFYVILYKILCLFCKQDKNKVLFLSASRDSLTGNFEFIYKEIKKHKNYYINVMLKKSLKDKYSIKQKFGLIYLIATSKYIFLDDFYPMIYALKLRKNTELIQLWHAMGAFKRVGYSRGSKVGAPVKHSLTHKNYTGTIVSSEYIRKDYAEAFGISIEKVHALGIPRTDVFFDENYRKKTIEAIYKKYPQLKNKKVMLFAPTFRGNGQKTAYYNFDWFDFEELKKNFSRDYICIIKLHPFIKNKPDYDFRNDSFFLDLSSVREINDLLFVTDLLITDYSSVIFEYSFFKKPIVFYVPDLNEYKNSRDFYYPLDKYTYGEVAMDFESLINCVKNNSLDIDKLNEFYEYFCSSCDGKSSKRVVDYYINNKK